MTSKLLKAFVIVAILALGFALLGGAKTAQAMPACDPAFVTLNGTEISVGPTGVDDTANIQCAFDLAVAAGPGKTVRLGAGTFHTAQVVVDDFQGRFSGAGVDRTLILNLPDLYVTPVDFYLNPPSAANPAPILFTFINGSYTISDLAIHLVGDSPAQGWSIFGIDPPLHEFAVAIACLGTEAHVQVDRVFIKGEPLAELLFGVNLIQAIYFEGFIGSPSPAISGSFSVQHSTFQTMASGTPIYNVADASIVISDNTYADTIWGLDAYGLQNSILEFSNNVVASQIGGDIYNMDEGGNNGNTFLVLNNRFSGEYGPILEYTGEGNQCLIKGNNVQNVTEFGVVLAEGVHGCTVVGGDTRHSVLNLGTDNVLTGVNNMGTGVGPVVSSFMRMRK